MTPAPDGRCAAIEACMKRLSGRYARTCDRMGHTPLEALSEAEQIWKRQIDRKRLREWFEDRMMYLQEEYRMALNDSDNVIGKQWAYDHVKAKFNLPSR